MYIGQTLLVAGSEGAEVSYYTPWFSRGGQTAEFAFEVIAANSCTATVVVQTKNSEMADEDTGVVSATAQSLTLPSALGDAPEVTSWSPAGASWKGCLELVRFKITLAMSGSGTGFLHSRPLNPSWVTN